MNYDFEDFCLGAIGKQPFPWQRRLAARLAGGEPPETIAVPTGLGKTAVMIAWVWALANQQPGVGRKVPMRLVYVAPRRVIVDDATELAASLADRLAEPPKDAPVLKWARERLLTFTSGEGLPLLTARLRGAIPRDNAWYSRVDQPSIIVSTADMAGSGFLFRHWTSSPGVRPIVAGLLGIDSMWVVDESHVQSPLVATLSRCEEAKWERDLGLPTWRPVCMSATPPTGRGRGGALGARAGADDSIGINDDDRQHPIAKKRLAVRRNLRLHDAGSEGNLTKEAVDLAVKATDEGASSVLVVMNTVEAARNVHAELVKEVKRQAGEGLANKGKKAAENAAADRVLLVHGQQREIERTKTMEVVHRACPMEGGVTDGPWYVVATSAIEVGADLSADHMVTQSCSFDSLIQRAGRVGRRANKESYTCDIVHVPVKEKKKEEKKEKKKKEGEEEKKDEKLNLNERRAVAVATTFTALSDFSNQHDRCAYLDAEGRVVADDDGSVLKVPDAAFAPSPDPLPLWPADLLALACTRPGLGTTVNVQKLIDGCDEDNVASVSLVWRADLGENVDQWPDLIDSWPIRPHELVQVPIYAARAFLKAVAERANDGVAPYAVRAGQEWEVRDNSDYIGRDAVIVIPTWYGGYGGYGFDPQETNDAIDVADVLTEHPDGPRLRVPNWATNNNVEDLGPDEQEEYAREALEVVADKGTPEGETAQELLKSDEIECLIRHGQLVWRSKKRSLSDDDGLCYTGRVTLADHQADVARRASAMAERCGLAGAEREAVQVGAQLHDAGKTTPTTQQSLGAQVGEPKPLAKSGEPLRKHKKMAAAAGQPEGWRHEAVSGILAERLAGPLVGHLAGSSHGWGRPWYRACGTPPKSHAYADLDGGHEEIDDNPYQEKLDVGLASRFVALHIAYGPWALAWMEAAVRLADWEASGAPAEDPQMPKRTGAALPDISVPARTEAPEMVLTGLSADKCADWLAAVGLLAVCSVKDLATALCWGDDELHTAVLHTNLSRAEVIGAVLDAVADLGAVAGHSNKPPGRWASLKLQARDVFEVADEVKLANVHEPSIVTLVDSIFTRLSGSNLAAHELVANLSGKMALSNSVRNLADLVIGPRIEPRIEESLFEGPQRVATKAPSFGFDSFAPSSATTGATRMDAVREILGLIGAAVCSRTTIDQDDDKNPIWERPVWHVPLGLDAIRVLVSWPEDMSMWHVEQRTARSILRSQEKAAQYRAWADTSTRVPGRAPGSARRQVRGTKRSKTGPR